MMSLMIKTIDAADVIGLATHYEVDQSDMLESFICELLNITPDELYKLMEENNAK